ncbi:MAG: epoxyqueuosine reductase QueH [Spirochaetota bacterium]
MNNNYIIDVCCGICLLGVYPQLDFNNNQYYFVFSGDNICCENEYNKRKEVFLKVCEYYKISNTFIIPYNHEDYLEFIKGYESEKEGGARCILCFKYRFIKLFKNLKNIKLKFVSSNNESKFDKDQIIYFSTTLSVSRFKNYENIKLAAENFITEYSNNLFEKYSEIYNNFIYNYFDNKKLKISFYEKNFRNDELYKNGIKIAKELNLYRQKFCGCEFSKIVK